MEIFWLLENKAELGEEENFKCLLFQLQWDSSLGFNLYFQQEKMSALAVSGETVPMHVSPEVGQSSSEQSCSCDSRALFPVLVCSAPTAPSKLQCMNVSAESKAEYTEPHSRFTTLQGSHETTFIQVLCSLWCPTISCGERRMN